MNIPAKTLLTAAVAAAMLCATACSTAPRRVEKDWPAMKYPDAPRGDHVDEYHGVKVADPYRWMEDVDAEATRAWVTAQEQRCRAFLDGIPERAQIAARLEKLWNYERYSAPGQRPNRYYYYHNNGLQNHAVLYTTTSLDAPARVLMDPNTFDAAAAMSLGDTSFSNNGKLMAYALSRAGSDAIEWHVRDVETGKDLPDLLTGGRFGGAEWAHDDSGFYYARFEETGGRLCNQRIFFHRIGAKQETDELIYSRPGEPDMTFGVGISDDGRYMMLYLSKPGMLANALSFKDLTKPGADFVALTDHFDAHYGIVETGEGILWISTDWKAPNGRVMAVDTANPGREHWREVIPERAEPLEGVNLFGGQFIATYLKDVCTRVVRIGLDGKELGEIALPGLGTAGGFRGKRDYKETFYVYSSFDRPGEIYRYDLTTNTSTLWRAPKVAFDPTLFETRQVFYHSADGTRVPMFVSHRKGIKRDGSNPVLMDGYGGFGISQRPAFSITDLAWMEMGGVSVTLCLRGGGEYGKAWHEAGTKLDKQHTFDDCIAAAEWLIDEGYTRPERLALIGRSNGGLLVGAVMTQRPELFGAVLPEVGVLDMLRYHKFTIGWSWASDYGTSDDLAQFKALLAYSPVHNVKRGAAYPPALISTADHDDRVVPQHSFKFAAELQAAQAGPGPILLRIERQIGHGQGTTVKMAIDAWADRYAFLLRCFDMKLPEVWAAAR